MVSTPHVGHTAVSLLRRAERGPAADLRGLRARVSKDGEAVLIADAKTAAVYDIVRRMQWCPGEPVPAPLVQELMDRWFPEQRWDRAVHKWVAAPEVIAPVKKAHEHGGIADLKYCSACSPFVARCEHCGADLSDGRVVWCASCGPKSP